MTDELEVIDTAVDTTFFVDNHKFTTADVMAGIDGLLDEIENTGEFERGCDALRSMSGIARVTGWASAKLCHGMFQIWNEQGHDVERFIDYVRDATRLRPLTIERYIAAWVAVTQIPQIADQIVSQPIKNGIALGKALEQGYEPSPKQIEQLADAKTNAEFLTVIRDVKNKPARKGSLTIYLDPDGSLQAWNNGKHVFVGDLDIKSDNPTVQKAVKRIIDGSGIIQRKQ